MEYKDFDLIFSIGEACSCTQTLRKHNLQVYSYPFDWLFGSDFVARCSLLAGKFENFIEKADLEYSHEERSIKCQAYHNKRNDLTFNHDFLKTIPFDKAYEIVREKYNRRISRLLKKINKSKSVLVVFMEVPYTVHEEVKNEDIIKGYNILKDAFGDKINLLYIKNTTDAKKTEFFENNKIIKKSLYYKEYDKDFDIMVNFKNLEEVFSEYRLNLPLGYLLKKKIIKILVCIIPVKSVRENLRKKYHV